MKLRGAVFGLSIAALILALALLSNTLITSGNQTATQTNADLPPKTRLTVVGYGTVKYSPNVFDITLTMIGRGGSAHEALTICSQKVVAVIEVLKSLNVTEQEMETRYVNVYPLYDWEAKPPKILEYEAQYTLEVKIKDVDKIGEAIDKAVKAGADRLDGIIYTASPEKVKELKINAIEAAVKDAENKAEIIAKTLGLKILNVESIDISESSFLPPIPYKEVLSERPMPIIPGEGEVTATVTITYSLGQAA